MDRPLVTMITYCYNGERFLAKYFDAILAQTYTNIELIFYNNGSVDKTGEIAESYRPALEAKGILVNIIHYDENQCTCKLKQDAFQRMQGEYFFGCDSDDLIDSTYVEEMMSFLKKHPEKGIVYCQLRVVYEETGEVANIMKMTPRTESKEAFRDILSGYNVNFTAISYMMSTKHFIEINPTKTIYISNYGENYQIQTPFLYHDLQGYIEKPLGQYTIRKDSYTGTLNEEKRVRALKGQEESVTATLKKLSISDHDPLYLFFLKRIRKDRFNSSLHLNDDPLVISCYQELSDVDGVTARERLKLLLYRLKLLNLVIRIGAAKHNPKRKVQ